MSNNLIKIISLVLLLVFLLPGKLMGDSSVKISSDAFAGTVGVGETFHITIEATNCVGKLDLSQLPQGVKVVYNTSQQTSQKTVIQGKAVEIHTTSLILTCKGVTPGKYTFGPVAIDGKKSNTITYQVTSTSRKTPGGSNTSGTTTQSAMNVPQAPVFIGKGNEEMFLKANVNKTTAYEQEAIEYIVKLYTTYGDIKFLGAAAAPKFDGFVVEESDDISTSFAFEEYQGKNYKTAVIARYIIFPQKAGTLKVTGNTYTVSTDARQYYHDPYFQTMSVKYPVQLNVTPNEVNINVKALPQPIPDNFIGGVGKFSISASMPSTSLTTNTPASIVYRVEGIGNVKYVKLPDLACFYPKSIEIYTPEVSTDVKVGSTNVSGNIKFDYSMMPAESGDFTIPALELYYFDPEDSKYKNLYTQDFKITVALGQVSAKSQQTLTFDSDLIRDKKLTEKVSPPYVNTWLYWLWFAIPSVLFILTLVCYRKYLRDHENLTLLRSKQANKMALKRLSRAYQCYKNSNEEQFYNEMLAALWGYIGDKLKMPTSELNRANVGVEFKKHNVTEATFMPIINLIDECEYAKYTPVSREANMRLLYSEALESLAKVESEYQEEQNNKNSTTQDDDDAI